MMFNTIVLISACSNSYEHCVDNAECTYTVDPDDVTCTCDRGLLGDGRKDGTGCEYREYLVTLDDGPFGQDPFLIYLPSSS